MRKVLLGSPSMVGNRGTERLSNLPLTPQCLLPPVGPSPPSSVDEGGAPKRFVFLCVAGRAQGSVTGGWGAVFSLPLVSTSPSGRRSPGHRSLVPPAMQLKLPPAHLGDNQYMDPPLDRMSTPLYILVEVRFTHFTRTDRLLCVQPCARP